MINVGDVVVMTGDSPFWNIGDEAVIIMAESQDSLEGEFPERIGSDVWWFASSQCRLVDIS